MVIRIFTVVFCIVYLIPIQGAAQQAVGVDWDIPNQKPDLAEELQHFSELGISYLQIHQSLDEDTWDLISKLNFTVFGKLPVNFPITQTFTKADSNYKERLKNLFTHYNKQLPVQSIGLLSYGNWTDSLFQAAIERFAKDIIAESSKKLYYVVGLPKRLAADTLFDFQLISRPILDSNHPYNVPRYIYQPKPGRELDPAPVKQLLEYSSTIEESIVFLNSGWLNKMENKHENFASILTLYTTTTDPAFPLPRHKKEPNYSNSLIILMLLAAWIVLAIAYNYNSVYRKSFIRYYSAHNFYIYDVMRRHLRSTFAGITMLLQHCVAGGIVLYCLTHTGLSPLGIEALSYHYPVFSFLGHTPLAIFFLGFLLTLGIEIIIVLWLLIASSKTTYLSQILNLYPLPLQLNLVIATVILGLYLAGSSALAIYLLSVIFVAIFIFSFIITTLDIGLKIYGQRMWFFVSTIGLYAVLLTVLIGWFTFSQHINQVMELVTNLP